jgi:hypothetical protein
MIAMIVPRIRIMASPFGNDPPPNPLVTLFMPDFYNITFPFFIRHEKKFV